MSEQRIEKRLAAALGKRLKRRPPLTEYRPCKGRQWRIDVAFPRQKLAIEIHGRYHARMAAIRKDAEKQNWLTAHGWRTLVYPASCVLTAKRLPLIVEQIVRVLHGVGTTEDEHVLTG